MFTCCSGSYDKKDYGNCDTNKDLDGTCFDKRDACFGKCVGTLPTDICYDDCSEAKLTCCGGDYDTHNMCNMSKNWKKELMHRNPDGLACVARTTHS